MIRRIKAAPALILIIVAFAAAAGAQSAPKPALKNEAGFTSYAAFEGTSDADGQVYAFSPSVGYNFSRHFGMDLGVPFYFVRASSSLGGTSSNGIGNPSVDLRLKFLNPAVNFASVVTGTAPVGDSKKGLSTGRGTYDWTNRFDHAFGSFTPFCLQASKPSSARWYIAVQAVTVTCSRTISRLRAAPTWHAITASRPGSMPTPRRTLIWSWDTHAVLTTI